MKEGIVITKEDGTLLYTKEEVAALLGVSVSTIDRYIANEVIEMVRSEKLKRVFFTKKQVRIAALKCGKARALLMNELKIEIA